MAAPVLPGAYIWRDYVLDGVSSSGFHKPDGRDIRPWSTWVETIIGAFTSNGGLIYSSRANLYADLGHAANSMAWVIGDPVAANNGVYGKVGASGSGSWVRRSDLPFSFIIATDTGAGTPNAIQATTSIPVSGSALVWLNVFEGNTASPATVSFNGAAPLIIKTNTGGNIAPGGLMSGMIVMGIAKEDTFRLVSDHASASIIASAEAAAADAQEAAAAASAAAAGVSLPAVVPVTRNMLVDNASGTARESKALGDVGGMLGNKVADGLNPAHSWRGYSELGAWGMVGYTATNRDGNLLLTSTTADPRISAGFEMSGLTARYVAIRYRVISGVLDRQFYWATNGHGIGGVYDLLPQVSYGEWVTHVADMWHPEAGGDDWKDSTVTSLRFDFINEAGGVVEVAWIALCADTVRRGDAQLDARYLRITSKTEASIEEYGASSSKTAAQNYVAIQAALDEMMVKPRGGALFIPPTYYPVSGGLTFTPGGYGKNLTIRGVAGASVLAVQSGTVGLEVNVGIGNISISDVHFQAESVNGFERMLDLTGYDQFGVHLSRVRILRTGVMPGFVGVQFGRAKQVRAEQCYVQTGQNTAYSTEGIGFQAIGENEPGTDWVFDGCIVQSTGYGFVVIPNGTAEGGGYLEGIIFDGCSTFGVETGLLIDGIDLNSYKAPVWKWLYGHINATKHCVVLKDVAQVSIVGGDFYLDSSATPQAGIYVENAENLHLSDNKITAVDQTAIGVIKNITGIAIGSGVASATIRDNIVSGTGPSNAIVTAAGSARCKVAGNVLRRLTSGSGVAWVNAGTNNTDGGGNEAYSL